MMKPSIIVTWPDNCDYPLWRKFYYDNRDMFEEIYIVKMETHDENIFFDQDIINDLENHNCTVLIAERILNDQGWYDWRHCAVATALKHIHKNNSSHIFFTEQDFLPNKRADMYFMLQEIENFNYDYAYIKQGDRHHPACLFVSKKLLTTVRKDFAALPGVYDHFYNFTSSCNKLSLAKKDLGNDWYTHMNGLSHNWYLVLNNKPPVYMPDAFCEYLQQCLALDKSSIYISQKFIDRASFALTLYKK